MSVQHSELIYFFYDVGGRFSLFSEGKLWSLQLPLECTYGQSGGKNGVGVVVGGVSGGGA